MAEAPVVGLETLYETTGGAMRSVQISFLGGTPEEQPERYKASSALTYVEQVSAPVLILLGRNDTRSPARPIELYEQKMKEQGKAIEVVWFDAGHISSVLQSELGIAYQEHMLLKLPRWITEAIVSIVGNTTTFTCSLSASSPSCGKAGPDIDSVLAAFGVIVVNHGILIAESVS